MDSNELRADIPALQEDTYLNFGAHGPSPEYVVNAASEFIQSHEYDTNSRRDPYEIAFETYDNVRDRTADFIGANPSEVALTESTSAGINAIANAIDWEPGDTVVRTDLEHPAVTLPWQRLAQKGVNVRVIETEDGRVDVDTFTDAVRGARLVCFSAITWTHGTRLPVAELVEVAHDAGTFVLVDAVQVPGQLPMDVKEWGADAVAAAGHKWLLGLWGGGILYVDHQAAEKLHPSSIGYRGVETPTSDPYEFSPGARRFEVGSANPASHVALAEAIDVIDEVGVHRIADRIQTLSKQLIDEVPDEQLHSPPDPESGLVTIEVEDPEQTVNRLSSRGIVVRSLPSPNAIRASVHAVNTSTEIADLVSGLETEWD